MTKLSGSCLCGSVRFEVEDAFESVFYCHCSRCRRRTGSAFAAIGAIPIEKLVITSGAERTLRVGENSQSYNSVCQECHCQLYSAVSQHRRAHVPLGTLATAPSRKPELHIQVASKAPWYTINDDLPQYAEFPP
jgi:hypothetical protein